MKQEDIELFYSYSEKHDMYLIKLEFERKVINYSDERTDTVMYFGDYPHYPEEKMLEITCEGCKSINISDYIYDFVAPHRLILENISDTWIEGANYYVHDNESDIKIYCLDVKFKIV